MSFIALNYIAIKCDASGTEPLRLRLKMTGEHEPVFEDSRGTLFAFESSHIPMEMRKAGDACYDLELERTLQQSLGNIDVNDFHFKRSGNNPGMRGNWLPHPFKEHELVKKIDNEYLSSLMGQATCGFCEGTGLVENTESNVFECPSGCAIHPTIQRAAILGQFNYAGGLGFCDSNGKEIKAGDKLKMETSINQDVHGQFAIYKVVMVGGIPVMLYESSETGEVMPSGYTGQPLSNLYDEEEIITTENSLKIIPTSSVLILC